MELAGVPEYNRAFVGKAEFDTAVDSMAKHIDYEN
jgi:hypothetical protein